MEYDRETLKLEYERDIKKGLEIDVPKDYFKENNPAKGHCCEMEWPCKSVLCKLAELCLSGNPFRHKITRAKEGEYKKNLTLKITEAPRRALLERFTPLGMKVPIIP